MLGLEIETLLDEAEVPRPLKLKCRLFGKYTLIRKKKNTETVISFTFAFVIYLQFKHFHYIIKQ